MRETILNSGKKSHKIPNVVYTIAIVGLAFCVFDIGFIEEVEGLIVAIGIIAAVIFGGAIGWKASEFFNANVPSAYDGGIANSEQAFEKIYAQMEKWEIQYAQLNNDQKNLLGVMDGTTLDTVRKCENEVPSVLSYSTWAEAKSNMNCFDYFNITMESIAVNIMGNYGAIDLDVVSEMRSTDLIVYSDVYQPAYSGNPVSNPDQWLDIDTISYGIQYAGNFDIDGDYKLGDYYLNYVYVPSGETVTIDGVDYEGETAGEIFNFASFVDNVIYPTTKNITYISSQDTYINGIYVNSFGPNTFGDIDKYNIDYNGIGTYDRICSRDTLGSPTPPNNCGTLGQGYYYYDYSPAISTDKLYLDTRWSYSDLPNVETEISSVTIYIDIDNDTTTDITQVIPVNQTTHDIRLTFEYDKDNYPALFNPTVDTSSIKVTGYIAGSTNDVFLLRFKLRNSTNVGENNLFFREEYNNPIGVYYPITFGKIYLEEVMPSKNLDEFNKWQVFMDDNYIAMDNSAFALWIYHKSLGRNSIEDVPISEITLYPDIGFSNMNSLADINNTEAQMIYYAILNQLYGQFEEFKDLYNLSFLDSSRINISNFNDYVVRLNGSRGNQTIPETYYWISPMGKNLFIENNTCYVNDQPILIMDLLNNTIFTMQNGDYYCIKGIMAQGVYIDNATYEIQALDTFTTETYGFNLDSLTEALFPFSTENLLYYAGISAGIGIGIMILSSVSDKFGGFRIIGQIALIIGILIAIYWGISEFVWPWLVSAWETLSQWWDTITFWD